MDNNMNTSWWQRCRPSTRRLVQLYSALLYNAHLKGFIDGEIYVGKTKYACVPGFNCYSCPGAVGACPLGSIQNALASSGHQAGWYVLGIIALFGVILGRTICGWLCPLGLIQELLNKIPTPKIRKSRITRAISWLKYILLAVFVVAIPLWFGLRHNLPLPGFCKYICPAGTFEGAMGLLSNPANTPKFSMLGILFTRKFIIMLVIGALCIFCYRSFCRFICPLGAIYGFFNRFNVIGVKVDENRCNGCGNCVRNCGMDVRHVGDHECINCGKCMDVCAQKAISIKAGSYTLRAPEGGCADDTEHSEQSRKHFAKVFWGVALGVLCVALLWFNFLDPTVKKRSAAKPTPTPPAATATVTPETEPAAGSDAASSGDETAAPVSFESDAPIGYEVGQQLADFTTPTFDGGEFHLADTRGKIVFINLWGTYCTPCVKELPDFEALYEQHPDDVAMLAVHSSMTGEVEPQDFVKTKGWEDWKIQFALDDEDNDTIFTIVNGSTTLPQTIVLNRRGEVIYNEARAVTPAMLDALYQQADASVPAAPAAAQASAPASPAPAEEAAPAPAAEETAAAPEATPAPEAEETAAAPEAAPAEKAAGPYQILVTDQAGNPVVGATVQFCSDSTCMLAKTGSDGIAVFDSEPGSYTVHVQKVPKGYVSDSTEYTAPAEPGLMTIVLEGGSAAAAAGQEPAAAEKSAADENEDRYVIDEPKIGLHFVMPEKYRNLKGTFDLSAGYLDDGILQITTQYFAVSEKDMEAYNEFAEDYINAWLAEEELPEAPDPSWMSGREAAYLFEVFSMNSNRSEEELHQELAEHNGYRGDNFAWFEKIGSDGEYSFYAGQYPEFEEYKEEYREAMGEYFDEFESLVTDRESFLGALTLSAPGVEQNSLKPGDAVSFETTDLDGNPVSSKELFAGSKVTMVNLWATWCHACKEELPALAELAKQFEKNGCQIVGICLDADEEGMDELAREILKQNGVDYLNLVPPEGVDDLFPTITFPTSFFFDSEGRMIGEPIRGAYVEQYLPALEAALGQTSEQSSCLTGSTSSTEVSSHVL